MIKWVGSWIIWRMDEKKLVVWVFKFGEDIEEEVSDGRRKKEHV